jgi:hypothetical protein
MVYPYCTLLTIIFYIYIAMYAAFAGYLDEGSEVIVMEPFFDQYIVS